VAVLGSGIVVVTPTENRDLARRITESGLLLSEAPPGARPSTPRLLARNRLQVGLARAVVVVQAGATGGAMQTAEHAFKTGKLVCAVDWPAGTPRTEGNRLLLDQGARPLHGPEDLANLVQELIVSEERRREQAQGGPQGRLFAEES
jgi:DNA processing protein